MHAAIDALYSLTGKFALVTGGSRGIGYEIARTLAAAGARVLIVGRDAAACAEAAAKLQAEHLHVIARAADLADEAQIDALFAGVHEEFGSLDILVNCAGSFPKFDFLRTTREQWDALQQINLRSAFVCMQRAIAQMCAAGRGGRIINISSVSSLHPGTYGNAAYSAAKAGLNALTRNAALEFTAQGITVNAVLPGAIASRAPDVPPPVEPVRGPAADPQRRLAGRLGTPAEVAAAVLFFASPGGAYTSGQTLIVDGGFLVG